MNCSLASASEHGAPPAVCNIDDGHQYQSHMTPWLGLLPFHNLVKKRYLKRLSMQWCQYITRCSFFMLYILLQKSSTTLLKDLLRIN